MNDPWDVKSVRRAGQYVSCMKINGVPLLPPVLSKECREEMQYYKLLAKEVEKRVSNILSLISCDSDGEDKTDASELQQTKLSGELSPDNAKPAVELNVHKVIALKPPKRSPNVSTSSDTGSSVISNVTSVKESLPSSVTSPKLIIDFSVSINKNKNNSPEKVKQNSLQNSPVNELPERDYNCLLKPKTKLQNDVSKKQKAKIDNVLNCSLNGRNTKSNDIPLNDGPSSLSAKSFTGSLNDIYTESIKESQKEPKLIRQRSYTVLQPSPQLLAHLESESLNTGVEMTSISMSDSLSNLSSPNKKRRSWDLETAKVKWSSMALELNQKKIGKCFKVNGASKNITDKTPGKKVIQHPRTRQKAKSLSQERPKVQTAIEKSTPKSDPIQRPRQPSPIRNSSLISKEIGSPKHDSQKKKPTVSKPAQLSSENEDPAIKVRELYEKIQRQQLMQMASLVEKQKKEQMLLQQVFEEQNNLLYKQLKTICPKSPNEIKEAWGEKNENSNGRGPVSLSQLINHKTPEKAATPASTLHDTNEFIHHADDVLKKSRNISSTLKKQQNKSQNGAKIQSPRSPVDGSRTRTHSPVYRNITSRKLNYDTTTSSERDYEPMTDRTNDTMADLNVTFPSDNSDDLYYNDQMRENDLTVIQKNANSSMRSTDSAIRSMEQTILNSINNVHSTPQIDLRPTRKKPTAKELAASSTIVAYAKGYLVRRLLKTERVQGTVQTIRDALLCALQLHQDRQGIRGADVDLHRRLIQQITAACYTLHDTFITSTAAERCAIIAADRGRRRSIAARATPPKPFRKTNIMSKSHSGSFPTRSRRVSTSAMTQSNYETFSVTKMQNVSDSWSGPRRSRLPWR